VSPVLVRRVSHRRSVLSAATFLAVRSPLFVFNLPYLRAHVRFDVLEAIIKEVSLFSQLRQQAGLTGRRQVRRCPVRPLFHQAVLPPQREVEAVLGGGASVIKCMLLLLLLLLLRVWWCCEKRVVVERSFRAREGFDVLKYIIQDVGLLVSLVSQGFDGTGGAKGGFPSREKALENVGMAPPPTGGGGAAAFVIASKGGFKGGSSGHAHNCCRHGNPSI
jgi:hypothetical protein